jgi:hypothetical protein
MKAALYARFSTDLQTESSVADQARVARQYAEQHGFVISAQFEDLGIRGHRGRTPRRGRRARVASDLVRAVCRIIALIAYGLLAAWTGAALENHHATVTAAQEHRT